MILHRAEALRNFHDMFFRMEVEEGLFSMQMLDGTFFWDAIRRDVYLHLHAEHGGPFAKTEPTRAPSLVSRAKDIAKPLANRISRRYLTAKTPKYIFITLQRQRFKGQLIDNISDPLYDLLKADSVAIELMNKAAIRYGNMLTGHATRLPPVAMRASRVDAELRKVAQHVNQIVSRHFGMACDIYRLVTDLINMFRATRNYYRTLFLGFRPTAIIGVNNGTLSGMYSAAREARVPAIELQHGASTCHTIFWSYPASIAPSHPGLSLPAGYFTFSDYWNANTHYPVRFFRSIGSDYFSQKPVENVGNDVLMISSYMYRDVLFDLTLQLAAKDTQRTVFFKLHPHEFDKEDHLNRLCQSHHNIRIVCDELEFSELLAACRYVVGVQSTAMYQALHARKLVCLLKHSNYFWHEDIFDFVELFESASELHDLTHQGRGSLSKNLGSIPEFFRPFSKPDFLRALDDVQKCVDSGGAGQNV
jgi:hypothetical protein